MLFTVVLVATLQLRTCSSLTTRAPTSDNSQAHSSINYTWSVSLLPGPFMDLEANITGYLTPANYGSASFNKVAPLYPGATVIVGHQNTIVSHFAVGEAVKYADVNGTLLPARDRIVTKKDTIYDMASLTKMFTTIAVLQQLDRGTIQLDGKVATYLPGFAVNGKENITILMLLTHTSGFDADPVPDLTNGKERRQAIINQGLIHVPGKNYLYSDLSFMSLQLVLEAVTSTPLDVLIRDEFTTPLGMYDTFFNRGNVALAPELLARVASTEFQIAVLGPTEPQRPQPVWGNVHDENAWSLNGVAGHAGMFSTAGDLAVFCQMILNNGTYGGVRILNSSTVDMIFHNYNTAFPGNAHGLGFELNQFFWSGAMQSLATAGHTGFTGTSMAIDRPSNTFFVLLNHRVHPSRNWSNVNVVREMLGLFVARALGRQV
ncbi:putative beta-lactamase [Collybia nuda]|uniref:Beta-lactamase n=1 Tax=Collybia nuda TaxID=64659 RepID=A0A9P5XYB1_9AGAR|nr:putative beta-lactamase [Collybia nuda]